MAEEIDLGSLNFDTDKLAQNLLDVRLKIDAMKNSLTDNRKAMRDSQKSVEDLVKVQNDLAESGNKNSDNYKKITAELDRLKNSQKETTKEIIQQEASVRTLNKEQQTLTKILDANTKATDGNTAAIDRAVSASQNEVKTIDQARASNAELLKLRNQLDISGGKNADKLQELNKALNANNKFIKENVSEYEQQKIGIGDYQNAIEGALGGTRLFGVSLSDVKGKAQQFSGVFNLIKKNVAEATDTIKGNTAATEGMSGAQKMGFITTQSLVAGLKLLRVALIATGIGAIVVALGSLVTFLATTQKGIDAVTSVTRPLTTVFQTLLGVIQKIGGNVFENPLGGLKTMYNFVKKQLVESFGALGKIIQGAFTLDKSLMNEGFDQFNKLTEENTESLNKMAKSLGGTFKEAWERGKEVDKLMKDLSKSEADFITQQAELKQELKEQNLIAEDQTKSLAEREAAAKRTVDISREINDEQRKRLEIERDIMLLNQQGNDTLDADLVALAEINKAIAESNAAQLELETTQQNKLNAIRKEATTNAIAENKARLDDAINLQKVELERFALLNKGRQQNIQEEIDFAQELSDKRLAILDKEYKAGQHSKQEYELAKLLLSEQAQKEEAEIVLYFANQRLNEEILALEKLRSERKRITEDSMQDEIVAINALQQIKLDQAQKQLQAGIISQREFNQMVVDLEIEKNTQLDEVDAAWREQRREDEKIARLLDDEQKLLDLTGLMAREREIEMQTYETRQEELAQQRGDGLISEENYLASLEQLNQKHASALLKIDRERNKAKLDIASNTAGDMATIFGEETEAGKFFASAQAAIDTYAAATAAYAAMAGIPVVGPALGAIAAAAAVVSGLKTISKIQGVDTNFYTGGYTGDGGMFERRGNVHAGEVVFSQADIQQLGGAANVESMRPTSDVFNDMPRGMLQGGDDNSAMMAAMIGEAVERGSKAGTSLGVIEAEDDKIVKERAKF